MEVDNNSCVSLTAEKDGSLRAECLSSPDILTLENGCKLYHTIPLGGDLQVKVKGTGYCVVAVHDGNTTAASLYLLRLMHTSTVKINLSLTESGDEVETTFNNDSLKLRVDPQKIVQAELLVYTGKLTTVLTLNGEVVLKQNFEMNNEEIEGHILENDSVSSEPSSNVSIEDENGYYTEYDDDDDDDNDDYDADDDYDTGFEKEYNVRNSKEDEPLFSEDDNTEVSGVENVKEHNIDVDERIDFEYDDDDIDSENDEEIDIYESVEDRFITYEVSAIDEADQPAYRNQCYICSKKMYGGHESSKNETVDIRTNRIKLLETMRSDRLADYFFEASLISEDNMTEIHQSWRIDNRAANGCFLQILRNKRVPRHEIEHILAKAEELHLLDLMFPKQSHFATASTQTDEFNISDQTPALEAKSITY